MSISDSIKSHLKDTFYSIGSRGFITRRDRREGLENAPSNRLAKALGVTATVAMAVAPVAGVGVYVTMVGANIEGEVNAASFEKAHRSLIPQNAQAVAAGVQGAHHDEGIIQALIEARKMTPMEVAAEANADGWSGEGIETLLKEHRIHLINGVFVADPSSAHETSEGLRMVVDFIRQGAAILNVPEAQFAAVVDQALAQFAIASKSYADISGDLDGSDLRLDTTIRVVSGENKAEIQFDMVSGAISVHEVGAFGVLFSSAPVISTDAYDEDGKIADPRQVIENAEALGAMSEVIETAGIMARLDHANLQALAEHGFLGGRVLEEIAQAEGPTPR